MRNRQEKISDVVDATVGARSDDATIPTTSPASFRTGSRRDQLCLHEVDESLSVIGAHQ